MADDTQLEDQTLDEQSDDSTEVDTEIENDEVDTDEDLTEDVPEDSSDEESNDEEKENDIDFESMSDEEFEAYLQGQTNSSNKEVTKTDNTEKKVTKSEVSTKEKSNTPPEQIDYKAVYSQLFKPFKANGKEITPRTVDDIVSLMQMGANYTKKMQLMAPMKKAVESLNKAKISEEELNFLIDIHKGNKEAISELLKRNNIDPLEVDLEENNYVPNNNIASDEDVEFSDVLQDVNPSLPKINDILKNTWDNKSREQLVKDPKLLRGLHEEIQMGRFDEVQKIVESEKTFGRYKDVSDIDAYIDVVTKLVAQQQRQGIAKPNVKATTQTSKPIPDKSKAAPTRAKAKSSKKGQMSVEDLFSLSDEDFNKLNINDLV